MHDNVSMWFGKSFLLRTVSTQHWSRVAKLQVCTSGELAKECISGGSSGYREPLGVEDVSARARVLSNNSFQAACECLC